MLINQIKNALNVRSSDATCNPYLPYSALLMAMLEGIKNKLDPQNESFAPYDVNKFTLSDKVKTKIKTLPKSLSEATDALEKYFQFLLKVVVYNHGLINNILKRIRKGDLELNTIPYPKELEKYFDL